MAELTELQSRFDGGMSQDDPMHDLPTNKVFLVENMLPSLEWQGAIQMRNGWADYSGNLSAIRAATTSVAAVSTSETGRVYAVDEDGQFWKFGPTVNVGASVTTREKMRSFAGKTIVTSRTGAAPWYYDGTTLALLAGSPPSAVYQEIHKGRLVLAGPGNRIWFSGGYDPTSWDTTNRYIDTSRTITGLVSVNNMLLVFSWDMIERIRGGIPPPGPGDDMVLEPVSGSVGCMDNRSIAVYGSKAIFAATSGLYETDGVSTRCLSKDAGMSSHWNQQMIGTPTAIAGVVYKDYYLCSLPEQNICYVIDLVSNSWYLFTNVKANMFTTRVGSFDDFFFASFDTPYVRQADNLFRQFEDSYQDSQDADGTRLSPRIQTAYYGTDRLGAKRWKMLEPLYQMTPATGSPTMTVSYSASSPDTTLIDLPETLSVTSPGELRRERIRLGFSSPGVSLDFQLTPGTERINTFRLYRLDANVHARESSRGVYA